MHAFPQKVRYPERSVLFLYCSDCHGLPCLFFCFFIRKVAWKDQFSTKQVTFPAKKIVEYLRRPKIFFKKFLHFFLFPVLVSESVQRLFQRITLLRAIRLMADCPEEPNIAIRRSLVYTVRYQITKLFFTKKEGLFHV